MKNLVKLLFVAVLAAPLSISVSTPSVSANLAPPDSYTYSEIDLHDGTIQKFDGTYYMYGTMYDCGFNWGIANTPFCGFGVSQSADMINWSTPTLLFSPNDIDPWANITWNAECGSTGAGCFNPRMIRRSGWGANDGVYILWFNSPLDYARNQSNAYNAMGCNGPMGPCGPSAGAPYGSYKKPSLTKCGGNGDFSIFIEDGQNPILYCTMPGPNQTIRSEQIGYWGVDGTGVGQINIAGLAKVESPGVFHDTASGKYILTYSNPVCGYCNGTPSGYAVGDSALGNFATQQSAGIASWPLARQNFDPVSCGGQPRTVFTIDGISYEWIDTWAGTRNETIADIQIEKLTYTPNTTATLGDGHPWKPEIAAYRCD